VKSRISKALSNRFQREAQFLHQIQVLHLVVYEDLAVLLITKVNFD